MALLSSPFSAALNIQMQYFLPVRTQIYLALARFVVIVQNQNWSRFEVEARVLFAVFVISFNYDVTK